MEPESHFLFQKIFRLQVNILKMEFIDANLLAPTASHRIVTVQLAPLVHHQLKESTTTARVDDLSTFMKELNQNSLITRFVSPLLVPII